MNLDEEKVRSLYDKFARFPFFFDLDAFFGRATENSVYRKKAIALLNLTANSTVLDVACGIGLNFKTLESYLQNKGKIVGIDISSESLKLARKRIEKHKWTNIELVNMSIIDYEPETRFDAVLCTFALEIIPDYEGTIERIYDLPKPMGRFAMIGMKLTSKRPYNLLNPFFCWLYRVGGIDVNRDIMSCIRSKFNKIDHYEECFFGFYYILSASKSHSSAKHYKVPSQTHQNVRRDQSNFG